MLVNAGLLEHSLDAAPAAAHGLWGWLFVGEVWRGMFLGQVVPALLFLGFALIVPESPRWLSLVGRPEQARTVLARLRGDDAAAGVELGQLEESPRVETRTHGRAHLARPEERRVGKESVRPCRSRGTTYK